MIKQQPALAGRTILLVEPDISNALNLQDLIVSQGGRVLTAYSTERAMLLATNAAVSDAVINDTFRGSDNIMQVLRARHVPYILRGGQHASPSGHNQGISPNDCVTVGRGDDDPLTRELSARLLNIPPVLNEAPDSHR